jgi:DNA-binding transcriptional regulator YhcF (GntR family)
MLGTPPALQQHHKTGFCTGTESETGFCYGRFVRHLCIASNANAARPSNPWKLLHPSAPASPLYRQLAGHYASAIAAGTLRPGDRMPSLRGITQLHKVSLSTALQVCRSLEEQGYVQARERSGYYVRRTRDVRPGLMEDRPSPQPLDPAQYVGIHAQVSSFVARGRQHKVNANLSVARAAPQHYPVEALRKAVARAMRDKPLLLGSAAPQNGNRVFRETVARRAFAGGLALTADEVLVTHGCIEALNLALRAITQPGDVVAVESPTFYGLLQVLESLGLQALEIPTSTQTGISAGRAGICPGQQPRHQGRGGGAAPAEPDQCRDARRPQAGPGAAVRHAWRAADRG